jgi:hypothetical protein
MVIAHVITEEAKEMASIERNHMVQHLARQFPTERSAVPFCHGHSGG